MTARRYPTLTQVSPVAHRGIRALRPMVSAPPPRWTLTGSRVLAVLAFCGGVLMAVVWAAQVLR